MEETYAAIRRVSNVLLVVGSGFGNWEDSKQYLTGEWSLSRGHLHKMPADGILMGSRVMVAKEAATAPAVKKLLVDTPGIESELEWETSYTGVVGGVVTVTSELGEPIHVVANRCALLWKEFDDKYFSIPREQVELALRLNKKDIITRLNADYQKPYFGCKRNVETGEVVPAELEEMSYGDVLTRLVDLTYVEVEGKPQRWVHDTYFSRVSKFITRTEERFRRESSGALFDQSELKSNPRGTVSAFIAKYPATVSTLLSVPDCDFFLELCRTGGKPVNFVPAIDAEFKTWFKKDSLWYSEDLDAVPEHDAQRVFILQGPVAVRYSTVVDEPVADILEGINTGFVNVVKESGAIAAAPVVAAKQTVDIAGVEVTETDGSVEVSIPTEESAVPSADEWLAALAASVSDKEWLQALISSTHVVEEKKWLANPVRQLLVPQAGQKYVVDAAGVRVFDSSIDISGPVIEITKKDASIAVVVNEVRPAVTELKAGVVALEMTFQHHPELSCAVHSEGSGFIDKVKAFYARFWVAIEGKEEESCEAACAESVMSPFTADFSITKEDIVAYRAALGLNEDEEGAPADFSTIVSWRPLIQSVFTKEVKGNLLDLVHLKHSYKLLSSRKASATFLPGDDIVSTSNVGSLRIIDSGKIVHGVAIISRKTVDEQMEEVLEPLVELHSEFLIRGSFEDFESTFSIDKSTDEFVPSRPEDVEILKAKSWLKLGAETSVNVGDHLSFELTTKKQYASIGSLSSVEVSGVLFRADAGSNVEIGTVEFTSQEVNESPVVAFLRQVQPADTNAGGMFANGGSHMLEKPLEIDVPTNALAYAVASRDLNPIHRSKYAAILGHLPKGKPIMHGLWTATKVRDLVISSFGLGFDSNVVDYDVNFDGMVYPGDKLFMQARHIGLDNGKKVLSVENEIVGDLEKEFGSGPDDAAEMKLAELAGKFPDYASPGKVTSALIAKMLASKMPGGFGLSAIKEYLSSERCLPSGRIESVLLHGLTQNPKQRLTDDVTAKKWLDGVVDDYAKFAGIDIPYLSKLGGMMAGPAMGQPAMQSSSLPSDFEKRLKAMIADQVEALNSYLGDDQLDWHRKIETEVDLREDLESSVSQWVTEHGEFYGSGIVGKFDAKKERQYDSYWNWAVQDAMELYYRTAAAAKGVPVNPKLGVNEGLNTHFEAMTRFINKNVDTIADESALPPLEWFKPYLCNRATPELLQCTQFFVSRAEEESSPELSQAVQLLVEQVGEWLNTNPVNMQIFKPTQPQLRILENGELEYAEVPREGVTDSINYVDEVARGLEYNDAIETGKVAGTDVTAGMTSAVGFESTLNDNGSMSSDEPDSDDDEFDEEEEAASGVADKQSAKTKKLAPAEGAKLNALRDSLRKRAKRESEKSLVARSSSLRYGLNENLKKIVLPHVHIRKPSDVDPTIRLYDVESTCVLLSCMREMASTGISFAGKVALLTGCGKNSIGAEIVKALLEGGATVFVTTSSFSMKTTALFREIYEQHGSRGSRLIVLPFNQASKVDVQNLVAHIYNVHKLDLDFVIPFAALSEVGRTITDIDSRSELAHRIMLTNTMRLLGEVVTAKKARDITTRPALVILPMSPNHGNFGGDGLYAESKLGVESLMGKWYSEGWDDQLSIVGAIIGWTRGTGLMSGNNVVAAGVEKMGMRTFSTTEMGFNLSALMHPSIVDRAAESPIFADLTGGMAQVSDLKDQVDVIRADIMKRSKLQASIHAALESDKKMLALPSKQQLVAPNSEEAMLRGMLDLRQVVVVTGFGEVSPWGNSRTRWEMESYGEFSLEGCIELAWLTGRIVFDKGNWVDAKTKEIVPDHQVKPRYEEDILKHSGIRIVEPELFDGYDPKNKMVLHQVAIDKKMSPIEVADREEALQFRKELGKENVDVFQNASGAWMIRLRKGSVLNIPRALNFDRFVAGQIPTGWSAERLGLSKDLADAVDPITLYVLASTMDAFVAAGVMDPYEFYQYVHVSEIGNTSGGGMGGMRALTQIYKNRLLGKSAPSDALQECFINTPPAWVNMLLLSSSGPIKTPVGACATAAESVDIGAETIKSGKARICIVGGYDDFGEEGAFEFAQMKATSDSVKETGMGREPKEMCRPCSTTRGGFMESHGAGIQLLMDAQLALEMGLPIYGIVALTNTATDKNGRSVPAPGQGILTTAREVSSDNSKPSPLLDVKFRRRQFDDELESIEKWYAREKALIDGDESRVAFLDEMKVRKVQSAQSMWGEGFYHGRTDIAPLRGALSVWNLDIDDLGAASFHGTGTKANDKNESEVTHKQMAHLGRSAGNPLPVICQKNLTGHPKGAAAAWMLNGLLQVLNTGLIPGNRQLDNTCETLRKYDHLVYPNRSYQTVGVKAVMMKSFGFGQAGGEVVLVHPDYLLSTLAGEEFRHYSARREQRLIKMNTHVQGVITGKQAHIQVKNEAPYSSAQESNVYLDPTARAEYDATSKTWRFGGADSLTAEENRRQRAEKRAKKAKAAAEAAALSKKTTETHSADSSSTLLTAINQAATDLGLASKNMGMGVDVEPVATFENLNGREDFIRRNFTDQEMAYCYSAPHPAASFAGRWAAKEAVIKAISSSSPTEPNLWKGAGAPLREIEIFMTASGAPSVLLSGYPLQVFNRLGLSKLSVSISHSGDFAVSQAVANFQE
ncbi:holo-[acyl-carrier-protein] synthase [Phytophthora cinnamomi]|uniref:holo-[acyl-carrier-protein] synthase n=1 Tax=Phytophthora cinnamomi TaxID=4785 RepID=UPI0035599BBA|nr:holo-[acyl-carrier-protein] synthase [Phytophthora cinnamomi]